MSLLSVPLKTILMYHADLQNEGIPDSYQVCDGTTLTSGQHDIPGGGSYTVPDLRNRFILGADVTKSAGTSGGTTNASSDAPGPKGNGGQHSMTLAIANLPAHTHTGTISSAGAHNHSGSTADSGGAHTHTASTTTAGAHTHAGSSTSTTGSHSHAGSSEASAGSHSHTVTDGGHTHTGTISLGQTSSINNELVFISGSGAGSGLEGGFNPTTYVPTVSIASAVTGITIVANGAHTHVLTIVSDGSHSHTLTITSDGDHTHPVTVASGGTHSHTLTITTDGTHAHNFAGDPTGSGTAFDTRPRYYGVVFIMKVKL